ncbi:retrovirus-related pol polyprotein from transposon TNT 1-94 [Tanacetum coccineum]
MNMTLVLMDKVFKLNYSTPTSNNQGISSNPRNRQIAQPGMNLDQDRQMQMVGGNNGLIVVLRIANQNVNPNGNGNVVVARVDGNANGNNGTQTNNAPVYDSDVSAEHKLLEHQNKSIPKPHQVQQNDSTAISMVSNMEQSRGTVEQHPTTVEETHAYFESLYNNLAIKVKKVNTINRKMKETNADLTTKLARYKNQEKCFEINQEKYDKLERCYQKSVYQEQSKFVRDFKSLANEADESLAKNKDLEFEIEHLLRAVVSQDIMPIVQNPTVVETSNLQTELERIKERFELVIQICLWCVDSGCSKHMTRNLKLLINFIWKFLGTVRFGNDHIAAILGYGDLQWGNILITRVYFVEGLGHNLFSVGQFCDSDLEVAFRRNTYFVRNLEGIDLLKGNRTTNLYTINLYEMASASPICLMARATSTKSWLWHQHLSHLNFDTINDLAKNDLVTGLPKFKYHKEHLCPSCDQGKSKKASHLPKPVSNSKQRLHLLHMDLCGPMRIESINRKRYVLVIVDDYSRYTWVHFLRSKDEAPKKIKTFLKKITVLLQALVIIVRTENSTEFKNQVLKEYFDSVGISHQASSVRTPQQNRVVE